MTSNASHCVHHLKSLKTGGVLWGGPRQFQPERRAESEVAHKWIKWLHNPCHLGGPHRFRAVWQNQSQPTSGPGGYKTPAACGSPPLQSAGQNQRWPTSGQGGYITPTAWGVPTASEREAESESAHKWAGWLHDPCCLVGPHRFRAGGAESEVAHKWARWLHNPCRLGSPPLQSGGQNNKWPTSGQGGYITPAA